jgi:glycosyltransferase involved in cell wall biosynthesis
MTRRLKVLFVAKRFPFPLDTGGKIRTAKLLEKLGRELDITLVSNVEHAKDAPHVPRAKRLCTEFHGVPWTEVSKYTLRFYLNVLRWTFSRYPVGVAGDYSAPFAETVRALVRAGRHDLIVCDYLQPSVNLRGISDYPTLLFQHNVESMILKRHAETARNPALRLFWGQQWRKMERYEREACARFTGVVAVSEIDRALLSGRFGARRVFTIPTAVDADYFRPSDEPAPDGGLVFTGSMDWLPNEDAILFFADEILGRIRRRVPNVTLTVVGRNPSSRLRRRLEAHKEIRVTGRVEDVRPYMAQHAVYVVPLRIGGGTRIKIYEAMAMGKAIVSTPIGAEGLPVRHGQQLLLAEAPEDFAEAVVSLLADAQARARLGRAARQFVEAQCSWDAAAAAFGDACREVARG